MGKRTRIRGERMEALILLWYGPAGMILFIGREE